jgi:hypothetical protein
MKRVLVGIGVAAGVVAGYALYGMWHIFRERGFY